MKQWLRVAFISCGTFALVACATTGNNSSNKRRIVTVNTPPPVQASTVSYEGPEAAAACDTRAMRKAALDGDLNNDIASITVEREIRPGVRTLTDLDYNCREFFALRLGARPSEAQTINATATMPPQTETNIAAQPSEPISITPQASYYRVRSGDTLYSIGRKHCTAWQNIASENDIRNERAIEPGDLLRLPAGSC